MLCEIKERTAFPVLRISLNEGESLKSCGGSVMAMSDTIALEGKMDGGFFKAVGRLLTGETFFMQHLKAVDKGWAMLSTPTPGDIIEVKINNGEELVVQKDGFLAGTNGIDVSSKLQNLSKGIFSGQGFFVVRLTGEGTAYLAAYGSVHEFNVEPGKDIFVDNGNIVAWENSLDYEITKGASSWVSAFTTGSGLMCRFRGKGKVWAQTSNLQNLAGAIYPYLPQPQYSSGPDRRD